MGDDTDRIEKRSTMRAPRARVWQAIGDSAEFGRWFGAAFDGPFVAGARVGARITDPPEHAGTPFDVWVEVVEPERRLVFRWHPYDPDGDPSAAPTTRVELRLDDVPEGTSLTVIESGFAALPPHQRDGARARNGEGWAIQVERVARHVGG